MPQDGRTADRPLAARGEKHFPRARILRFDEGVGAVLSQQLIQPTIEGMTMAYWDAPVEGYPPEHRDFARVWQKAEQIVFSRTLTRAPTRIARVEREFDPEATRKLKRESAHDIFIGGAELAGLALESDLVDECHLFLHPVIVGGGKPAFRGGIRRDLELLETRPFGTGVIHLHYRMRGARPLRRTSI